jgi:hypothetical protein
MVVYINLSQFIVGMNKVNTKNISLPNHNKQKMKEKKNEKIARTLPMGAGAQLMNSPGHC